MRVAVTGASSPLGQALLRRLPDAIAVGRRMTSEPCSLVIHAAAPDARRPQQAVEFHSFNRAVMEYAQRWRPVVVNVGSWWQYATGPARETAYTLTKDWQRDNLPEARTLVVYSMYSADKGFPKLLVESVTGARRMAGVYAEWRDFIHVDDVATACLRVADHLPGVYGAFTGQPVRPSVVAQSFGVHAPLIRPDIPAELTYPLPNVAAPMTHLADWIAAGVARNAKRRFADLQQTWEAP